MRLAKGIFSTIFPLVKRVSNRNPEPYSYVEWDEINPGLNNKTSHFTGRFTAWKILLSLWIRKSEFHGLCSVLSIYNHESLLGQEAVITNKLSRQWPDIFYQSYLLAGSTAGSQSEAVIESGRSQTTILMSKFVSNMPTSPTRAEIQGWMINTEEHNCVQC